MVLVYIGDALYIFTFADKALWVTNDPSILDYEEFRLSFETEFVTPLSFVWTGPFAFAALQRISPKQIAIMTMMILNMMSNAVGIIPLKVVSQPPRGPKLGVGRQIEILEIADQFPAKTGFKSAACLDFSPD